MKQRCIFLYAMPYSITDEVTGEINEGISLHYILSDNLLPVEDKTRGTKGLQPCKQSVGVELASKLTQLPGIYDVDFSLTLVKGKPVLAPIDFDFVGGVELGGNDRS